MISRGEVTQSIPIGRQAVSTLTPILATNLQLPLIRSGNRDAWHREFTWDPISTLPVTWFVRNKHHEHIPAVPNGCYAWSFSSGRFWTCLDIWFRPFMGQHSLVGGVSNHTPICKPITTSGAVHDLVQSSPHSGDRGIDPRPKYYHHREYRSPEPLIHRARARARRFPGRSDDPDRSGAQKSTLALFFSIV